MAKALLPICNHKGVKDFLDRFRIAQNNTSSRSGKESSNKSVPPFTAAHIKDIIPESKTKDKQHLTISVFNDKDPFQDHITEDESERCFVQMIGRKGSKSDQGTEFNQLQQFCKQVIHVVS
jgi:hypothetical protein